MRKDSGIIAVLATPVNTTQTSLRLRAASPFVIGDTLSFDDGEAVIVVASNGPFLEVTRAAVGTTAVRHAGGEELAYLDAEEIMTAVAAGGGGGDAFTPGAVDTPTTLHLLEVVQQMRNALIANGIAVDSGS